MKTVIGLLAACVISSAAGAQQRPRYSPIADFLPANTPADEYVVTGDGNRVYYSTLDGEIRMYDRRRHADLKIADGGKGVYYVAVARNGSAVGFTMSGEDQKNEFVWVVPLDPKTGLATGQQRQVSMTPGELPSFSPDGQLVAFARDDSAAAQSVLVAPVQGGPERVLASVPSFIDAITWTPDARTIFFATGGSVSDRTKSGSLYRISSSGGGLRQIGQTNDGSPGLSPDGSRLVFADTGLAVTYVVADANGKRLTTLSLPTGTEPALWFGQHTLVLDRNRNPMAVRAFDLATGQTAVLSEGTGNTRPIGPTWSPDGRRIAYGLQLDSRFGLVVANADGSDKRVYPLHQSVGGAISWSPDAKAILYRNGGRNHNAGIVVNLATGAQLELPGASQGSMVTWMPDSRALIAVGPPEASNTSVSPSIAVRVDGLDGTSRLVRQIAVTGRHIGVPIDDKRMVVMRGPDAPILIESIDGTGTPVQLFSKVEGYPSDPIVSRDHQWIAIRRNTESNDNSRFSVIDVVRTDGSSHATVKLPFFASPGAAVAFTPDDRQLIVAENSRGKADPATYLVTISSGAIRKLFNFRTFPNNLLEISLSPDGRTVLYANRDSRPLGFWSTDVSSLVKH